MEIGASVAARTVANMDVHLVSAALAQHLLVFDLAATPTGEDAAGDDVRGYRLVATRTDSWDAIVAVLGALDEEHPDYFHRVMAECRTLSNDGFELDGLHDLLADRDQVVFDLAVDREQRREAQGYVTPGQARTFLQTARQGRIGDAASPLANPVARAYFHDLDSTPIASDASPVVDESAPAFAAVVDLLLDAGVITAPPRALLGGAQGDAPARTRMEAQMQGARDRDEAVYATRGQELAFLANTIMAGCAIQGRPFTVQEASDAAVAVCNLGLENWPGGSPDGFLVDHDLVSVFQAGWAVLHAEVGMYTAKRLVDVLATLRHADREIQSGLAALRRDMARQSKAGTPWLARDSLDVIMILDMPAWAALVGLTGECPVLHAGLGASGGLAGRSVDASSFEFIAENRQIALVRAFLDALPATLRG